jgi:hypothetical protein
MVLWVYYSAQIFLFGAEFTWLFAKRFGSLRESGKNTEGIVQMPNNTTPSEGRASKATLNELFNKLLQDGKSWLEAELTLAKAEAGHRVRNYAIALGLGLVCFLILVGTLVVLAQACVTMLTPYVSGPAVAGLIVGIFLLAVVMILALVAKHSLVRKLSPIRSIADRLSRSPRPQRRGSGL